MKKANVYWFTGLSASGKTTVAKGAAILLRKQNKKIKIYDGDFVRKKINRHLGFSYKDILENNKIIAQLCLRDIHNYDYIFVSVISPFIKGRQMAQDMLRGNFSLIFIRTSLQEAIRRDPKGLYAKALTGKIKNFIGIDKKVPYEPPNNADLIIDTENCDKKTCINKLMHFIKEKSNI